MAQRNSIHDFLERTKLPLILIIAIPLAAVIFLFFAANNVSTTPAPQPPTPVSIIPPSAKITVDSPRSLPSTIKAGELVPFSFTVQNPSQKDAKYQYKVSVRWSTGENDVIDVNTLALAAGASATIKEQLKFEVATETAQVIVQLPQTKQAVQFVLPRTQ